MMMKNKIELNASSWLSIFLLCIHLSAVICVYFLFLPLIIKLCLFVFCAVSLKYLLWRYALLLDAKSIIKLSPNEGDDWYLLQRNGTTLYLKLRGDTVITPYFILLNFKAERFVGRSVLLLRDAMHADEFRRLRVRLLTYHFLST